MTDEILARIERNRNKLAELRDAKVTGKELYDGLTFVIGDLFHVKDNIRTAERLAKIEALEALKFSYTENCFEDDVIGTVDAYIDELKAGN